jgi:chromosomal replication initiation ATPase DnaA
MSIVEEYHAAHKARLARLGEPPKHQAPVNSIIRPARKLARKVRDQAEVITELRSFIADQTDLISQLKDTASVPDAVSEWVERQKAIARHLHSAIEGDTGPTIATIQAATCRHFSMTRNEILSERRTKEVVYPRQIAMYLCKTLTPRSLPEIGRRFGKRDHTTVLHAVRKIKDLIRRDCLVAYDVAHVEAQL